MSASATFAQLRALRAAGKKRLDSYQVQDQGDIYDEVGEEDYKKVVRSRLNQDDFVIDDNGEGYADDGREEWQNDHRDYSSDDNETLPLKGNAGKRKREQDQEKNEKTNHKILNYFNNGPVVAVPKPKVLHFSFLIVASTYNTYRFKRLRKMKPSWLICLERLTLTYFPRDPTRRKFSSQIHVGKFESSHLH
jgi:DNA polymerase alpha subunit p180 N terminal